MYKIVNIRYNTKSDGNIKCWRVVCDGTEYLTDKVVIKGKIYTSKDYMGDVHGYRHHVTIENAQVTINKDFALIVNCEKRLVRDILKTITYRILGTSVTFGLGFISTGDLSIATMLGFSDLVLKPLVYFLHERLWSLKQN